MNEKTLNVTLISRHDTEANWKTSSYVPEKGEVVIYDIDSTYNYERFKIGDGKKVVDSLPFAIDAAVPAWARAANKPSYNASEVGLGNVSNTGDSATPVSGGTTKFTTGGAYTELNKKVDKTTTVNGHALNSNVTVSKSDVGLGNVDNVKQYSTSNPPPYPVTSVAGKTGVVTLAKGDVGLGSVVNTGDSATPVSGGTTKFTTGGAYTELAKKVDKTITVNGHALSSNVTVTKSDVGLGNVENKSSATIRSEITSTNVTTALGYTPLDANDAYVLPSAGENVLGGAKIWKNGTILYIKTT